MAEYLIQDTTLDAIADAINAKTGGSSAMTPAEMVTAIGSISGGGGTTKTSYTQTESRETDSTGTSSTFRNAYLPGQLEDGMYCCVISNNANSSSYKAVMMVVLNKIYNQHMYVVLIRGTSGTGLVTSVDYFNSTSSFYTSANSVIDVYFTPKEALQ